MPPIWVMRPLPLGQRLLLPYNSQPRTYKAQDIVAVPVTRENCTLFEDQTSKDPGLSLLFTVLLLWRLILAKILSRSIGNFLMPAAVH
jgi:hypothetical protein